LDAISEAHQVTPTQIALAWLIARPGITAPIVSATSLKQLDDLSGAMQLTLTPAQIEQLNQASQ
ncbi:aldo/keto reductase, partial [Pantoea agglomerans]|nr:aldo/keto reductase [Pantoea agglomerans]